MPQIIWQAVGAAFIALPVIIVIVLLVSGLGWKGAALGFVFAAFLTAMIVSGGLFLLRP